MPHYRGMIHFDLKRGLEQKAIALMEKDLFVKAQQMGCHDIEFLSNEANPSHFVVIGTWDNIDDAHKFQTYWEEKQQECTALCTNTPQRELFLVKQIYYSIKNKKVA